MSLSRVLPDRLAAQLLALVIGALLLAFALATALIVIGQTRMDQASREALAADRVTELIATLEAMSPAAQARFAKAASTRTTRISVGAPDVAATADNDRSLALAAQVGAEADRIAHAAVLSRAEPTALDDPRNSGRNREVIAISVPLAGGGTWLNFTAQAPLTWHTSADQTFLLIVLGLMVAAVTLVVWGFVWRLTRPLTQLARAATRAARGDHSARVAEEGPAELREAAQAFNAMQADIARFDTERTRTIAAVGHDLRTPMTSLRIRAEMIDEDELREPMIATLDEMSTMAEGLIAYARDGREEERVANLDLAALLEDLCAAHGVTFHADHRPRLSAAPVSLTRAVGNLIDNAQRYGGGDVTVTLRREGDSVAIRVVDRGPGIPDGLLATVFDPFVRGENSRNSDTGGSGLGLAIARRILREHGGDLTLDNTEPAGLKAAHGPALCGRPHGAYQGQSAPVISCDTSRNFAAAALSCAEGNCVARDGAVHFPQPGGAKEVAAFNIRAKSRVQSPLCGFLWRLGRVEPDALQALRKQGGPVDRDHRHCLLGNVTHPRGRLQSRPAVSGSAHQGGAERP